MARRPVNPELIEAVKRYAPTVGLDPKDLLGIYSYETGGTLDPWQRGPTTKWGTHRGLIQWGQPQARKYGVTAQTPVSDQVAASIKYLQDRGFKPGMGLLEAYSAINAGGISPKHFQARDAAAGGAPGTVADKVNRQMGPHLAKATAMLGDTSAVLPTTAPLPPSRPAQPVRGTPEYPDSPLDRPGFLAASVVDPFVKLANERKEQQTQQALATAQQALAQRPEPAPAPPPVAPLPPVDYATLLMPRLRRGLLADQSLGLLGAP